MGGGHDSKVRTCFLDLLLCNIMGTWRINKLARAHILFVGGQCQQCDVICMWTCPDLRDLRASLGRVMRLQK